MLRLARQLGGEPVTSCLHCGRTGVESVPATDEAEGVPHLPPQVIVRVTAPDGLMLSRWEPL